MATTHPARQARSQLTAERVLGATRALLARRGLDELSVAEIAARAGVSIGGFYARFSSKDAVLVQLCDDRFFSRFLTVLETTLNPALIEGTSIPEVLDLFHATAIASFRTNRHVLRELARFSRTVPDVTFRERVNQFNKAVHRHLSALLLARAGEIHHPEPRLAVDLAIVAVSAVMREQVLFSALRPDVQTMSDQRLAAELTTLCCGYLGVARPAATRRTRRGTARAPRSKEASK